VARYKGEESGEMSFERPEEMVVVQRAHKLVLEVYRVSKRFPREELFGMTSQMRRAAVSVPSNICEGKARGNSREIVRFLHIARASLSELDYLCLLARDLDYITPDDYTNLQGLSKEVGKMTAAILVFIGST
jgi:four helix bundle protein